MIDLRLGGWQNVLKDVEADALITDPPYSPATHKGTRSLGDGDLRYGSITESYCFEFVQAWTGRIRGWWVFFGDDISVRWWRNAMTNTGLLYTFPPVCWVKLGAIPRLSGDGPAPWCEYLAVGRPKSRRFLGWGSLPGWYQDHIVTSARGGEGGIMGQKPSGLMRAIVRDYSRPGDMIVDPHAGTGSTLIAARQEARPSVGSEIDPNTFEVARGLCEAPHTPDLFKPSVSSVPQCGRGRRKANR